MPGYYCGTGHNKNGAMTRILFLFDLTGDLKSPSLLWLQQGAVTTSAWTPRWSPGSHSVCIDRVEDSIVVMCNPYPLVKRLHD